jgi:chitodextrinase
MKKLVLALGFVTLQFLGYAQNGLEKIIVEKYYISTKEDSDASTGTLPVGSVTYRVYADMLPGYRFQALYGNSDHPLKFNTSTAFFNNEDRGQTTANAIASAQLKNNTVALDSWFSVGASATGQFGVLKSEDDGKANLLTLSSILNNTDPALGIGLKKQDGNMAGSPQSVTFVGIDPTGGVFDATSLQGKSFLTKDGAISALNGATGPTAENRILLGQFTTDGLFTFELNIQIGTPTAGVSEQYVASNPITNDKTKEYTLASLIRTGNNPPVVEITSPANNAKLKTGVETTISVNATDSDGTITQVEFYVDGKSIGVDNSVPYSVAYTPTDGTHQITAKATDNQIAQTTSSTITISASNNIPPVITITAPKIAHLETVTINATASDADGTISEVAFYIDSVLVGTDVTAPYSYAWTSVLGKHSVFAIATDDKGEKTKSNREIIEVVTNILPEVTIISPTNNDNKIITGSTLLILANATDADGKVNKVEFFVDGKSVGSDTQTPYSANYVAVSGKHYITAVATDDQLATTTSTTINIEVKDNQLPLVSLTNFFETIYKQDVVKITANAYDLDGTITEVEFFVDSVSVGVDQIAPYTIEWIAKAGIHHIKAIAKDNNGAKTASTIKTIDVKSFTAGIEDQQLAGVKVQVYPNPATSNITFQVVCANNEALTHYQVIDNVGRIILEKEMKNTQQTVTENIDVQQLEKGVYHFHFTINGLQMVQKFIVE